MRFNKKRTQGAQRGDEEPEETGESSHKNYDLETEKSSLCGCLPLS